MDGLSLRAGRLAALPPEAPLAMPVQLLTARPSSRASAAWNLGLAARRGVVLGGAVAMTAAATMLLAQTVTLPAGAGHDAGILANALTAIFALLFLRLAIACMSGIIGLFVLIGRRQSGAPMQTPIGRTALLVPVYNEHPGRLFAALRAMHDDLGRSGLAHAFDIFVLSDSTDADIWIAEEGAWLDAHRTWSGGPRLFYRRRRLNLHRKSGNIADWIRRFGAAYEHFIVLDADSVMSADALIRLVTMMHDDPKAGLIQTLPMPAGAETPFARLQQFAARLHGPLIAAGAAWWHGDASNYWGHNAIIRTRAFAAAAGLPELGGPPPFGGTILSHDFVEAALLRRSGWSVRMAPWITGSYESGPQSLPDAAARDRRWCQGNLQHLAVLATRGLHPLSRLHLLDGVLAYLASPIWLLFMIIGSAMMVNSAMLSSRYFPSTHALFPHWPVMNSERALLLFAATLAVLLAPKLLAWLAAMLTPGDRHGFGGAGRLTLNAGIEMILSALVAPVMMLTQSWQVVAVLLGRDAGWRAQRRIGLKLSFAYGVRAYGAHTGLGVAVLGASIVLPPAGLWLLPVAAGLLLAVPLVVWTADPALGVVMRRRRLLLVPEERRPPRILVAAQAHAAHTLDGDAVLALAASPDLLAVHRAMLGDVEANQDPDDALVTGLAKVKRSADLNTALERISASEKRALLGSHRGVAALVDLVQADRPCLSGGRPRRPGRRRRPRARVPVLPVPAFVQD
jgi:membrane glycosyltransferase